MGAIGHPGDIERLRMAAIELASTEGFTRSAADVSLRRLAHYSLSPADEERRSSRFTARLISRGCFLPKSARPPEEDLFLRVDYDGSIATNGATFAEARQDFAVLSGTRESSDAMESFLKNEHESGADLSVALTHALDAWSVGHLLLEQKDGEKEPPGRDRVAEHRQQQLAAMGIEAAVLERRSATAIRYRSLPDSEVRSHIGR